MINPVTGYPAEHLILSATVFADNCMTADAWATAFMVMGHERGIEVAAAHPELDVLFVYSVREDQEEVYVSPRIASTMVITEH